MHVLHLMDAGKGRNTFHQPLSISQTHCQWRGRPLACGAKRKATSPCLYALGNMSVILSRLSATIFTIIRQLEKPFCPPRRGIVRFGVAPGKNGVYLNSPHGKQSHCCLLPISMTTVHGLVGCTGAGEDNSKKTARLFVCAGATQLRMGVCWAI